MGIEKDKHYNKYHEEIKRLNARYREKIATFLKKGREFLKYKHIRKNYSSYLEELYQTKILGKGMRKGQYIVVFTQKDPKESMLSFVKASVLGEGFSNIGANVKEFKYDKYDKFFQQFILTDGKEILGGYRFSKLEEAIQQRNKEENKEENKEDNQTNTPVGEYFNFNSERLEKNKDKAIELGTAYTSPNADKFAMLSNLKALGNIINTYNNRFYLGKMTIPTKDNYNPEAGNFAIYYLEKFFKKGISTFFPKETYNYNINEQEKQKFSKLFTEKEIIGNWTKDRKKIAEILKKEYGEKGLPNMFETYLGMSEQLEYCGTIKNPDGTLESGIVIPTDQLNDSYQKKFVDGTKGEGESFRKEDGTPYTLGENLTQEEQTK